jgi:hypothetical protein
VLLQYLKIDPKSRHKENLQEKENRKKYYLLMENIYLYIKMKQGIKKK